jgi:Fe-Mn family superoxide dismutase
VPARSADEILKAFCKAIVVSRAFCNSICPKTDSFKDAVEKLAMSIQGSGWVYMNSKGVLDIIHNHEYTDQDIVLIIDWWEHAWALDYQSDKAKYLKNIWRIIDWEVCNRRLT